MRAALLCIITLAACGPSMSGAGDDTPGELDAATPDAVFVDVIECTPPPMVAGPEVQIAAPYTGLYTAYDLGTVPGVPSPLGGATVHIGDDDTLLIAGNSENGGGAIYQIDVTRDGCGHITGFAGTATVHATTPYVDANLIYVNPALMLYTQWPQFILSQLPVGAATSPSPPSTSWRVTTGRFSGVHHWPVLGVPRGAAARTRAAGCRRS